MKSDRTVFGAQRRKDTDVIGKTIASEKFPNIMDSFWFIVKNNLLVSPFDFVTVDNLFHTKTIGIIKELQAVDYVMSHNNLRFYGKNEAEQSVLSNNNTLNGITLAKVAVMGNTGLKSEGLKGSVSVSMPVGSNRVVNFSTAEEILYALGIPEMKIPIPAGIVQTSNGLRIPISLDASYILGPDTTNVNASGISGNLKTSYLLFLMQSVYQKLKEKEDVALIIFNTKEEDLLHLHKKAKGIKEGTKKAFHILDLDLDPFENVTYFLPRGKDGKPNSVHIPKNSNVYSYELEDIYDKLNLLFAEIDDSRYNLSSITDYVYESWPMTSGSSGKKIKIQTWTDLFEFRDYPQSIISHKSSLLHFLGYLQRFRKSPLFIDKRVKSLYIGDELKKIKSHHVFVIDIALVSSVEEQAFIIADVMKAIDQMYTARYLYYNKINNNNDSYTKNGGKRLPNYILIFIDEINRFLPPTQPLARINSVAEQVMRTLIAGGSRGTVLFSAQQFKTATDYRLHEKTGLHIIAKLGLSELSAQSYSMLDDSTKRNITRLNRGELVMIHPAFRHPIKILFPRTSFIKH